MSIKIDYRGPVVWNIFLYLFFSLAFIFLQDIFKNAGTIAQKDNLKIFIENHLSLIAVYLSTGLFFYMFKRKLAIGGFVLSSLLTIILTSYNLHLNFSKYILIILFSYIILAFYLLQFYWSEVSESYYNSSYRDDNLFSPMLKKIPVFLKSNGNEQRGYLTNWSEEGCFVRLEDENNLKGNIELKVHFENAEFLAKGRIVAKEAHGIGMKLKENANEETLNTLGWKEFYEIIEQMGYSPELLV